MLGPLSPKATLRFLILSGWLLALFISLPIFLLNYLERENQAQRQLQELASHQQQKLDRWVQSLDKDLMRLAYLAGFRTHLINPLRAELLSAETLLNHRYIKDVLASFTRPRGDFLEIFLLDRSGYLFYSTDPQQIGKNKASRRYFKQGLHSPYRQNIYHSVTLQTAGITLSRPLEARNPSGSQQLTLGVLAARADLDVLQELIAPPKSRPQVRSYLVSRHHFFITHPDGTDQAAFSYPQTTYTSGVKHCLQNTALPRVYTDHRGQKVRGVGLWLPQHQLCLLVEEDYQSAWQLLFQQLFWLGVFLLPLSLAGWWLLPRRFIKPLSTPSLADSRFLSLLGHEVRTPLNGIIGMLSLLQESPLNPEQRQQAKVADASAQQLLNLLNHLIARARQGSGSLPATDCQWFEVNEPMELLLRSFDRTADQKGLALCFQGDAQLKAMEIYSQLTPLLQIISNLLENAVKFTSKGQVSLKLSSQVWGVQQRRLKIDVEDTGPGIAPEHQSKIFLPFERLKADPEHPKTSLGLGLAINRELAELLDADLQLDSQEGKGSRFTLSFIVDVRRKEAASPHQ